MSSSLKRSATTLLLLWLVSAAACPEVSARPMTDRGKKLNAAVLGAFDEVNAALSHHTKSGKKTLIEVLQDAGTFILN